MTRHILLLCLLGNPFELNLGGHQRTVSEIINHFKDTPQLELTVITTNGSLKELTANHLCSNITIYEIPIKKQWLENQDLLYNNKDFLYKTIKNIYENIEQPIALVHSTYWISGLLASQLCSDHHLIQIHSVISTSCERKRNGFPPVSSHQYESEQFFLPKVDCILSIAESEYELLVKEYHIEPHKIIVVGRTVADCFLHPSHLPSGNLGQTRSVNYNAMDLQGTEWWINGAFCYIGRIVDQKGVKEIILAWEILYKKYLNLTPPMWFIGGTAEDISKYRRIIKEYVPDLETYEQQHKYYTIQALVKELNTAMENHPIFNASEVNCTKSIFNKITHIRTQIPSKYGMNYGKSILNHIVQSNVQTFLLPSCDIYFGETGIDEAYTYMEYYGDSILEPLNSQKLQLIDNTVLLWIGVLLIEQYIENKILHKKCKIELSSISNFYDGFFETVLLLI